MMNPWAVIVLVGQSIDVTQEAQFSPIGVRWLSKPRELKVGTFVAWWWYNS